MCLCVRVRIYSGRSRANRDAFMVVNQVARAIAGIQGGHAAAARSGWVGMRSRMAGTHREPQHAPDDLGFEWKWDSARRSLFNR